MFVTEPCVVSRILKDKRYSDEVNFSKRKNEKNHSFTYLWNVSKISIITYILYFRIKKKIVYIYCYYYSSKYT